MLWFNTRKHTTSCVGGAVKGHHMVPISLPSPNLSLCDSSTMNDSFLLAFLHRLSEGRCL